MKTINKMSRLVGSLEKAFRIMNAELFDDTLPTPIITVVPSSRSYAHYTLTECWGTSNGSKHEINIASGTLDRPLEETLCSLAHEMVHMYNDCVKHVLDCSRGGTYHNRFFKTEAEARGLIVTRTEKYG